MSEKDGQKDTAKDSVHDSVQEPRPELGEGQREDGVVIEPGGALDRDLREQERPGEGE